MTNTDYHLERDTSWSMDFAATAISLITLWYFVLGCGELYESICSYKWSHVNGTVISSIERSALLHGRHGDFTSYWPEIRYEYEVKGVRCVGERIKFTKLEMNAEETTRVVASYPVGATVSVWFNPTNIGASVLEPGVYWPLALELIITFSLLTIFALTLFTDIRERLKA